MSAVNPFRSIRSRSAGRYPAEDKWRCVACEKPIHGDEQRVRLRGGQMAHMRCATYQPRRGGG